VARKGCRIWGQAQILTSGELFDAISKEYAPRNLHVQHVVKVEVKEVETF
jgi:hypothetical protein